MKFEELYNRVYVVEQEDESTEENSAAEGVPMPEDFDDVKPAPAPAPVAGDSSATEEMPAAEGVQSASTLKDYVIQFEEFAEKINGMDGESLQSLVSRLDRPGTPFDGISGRTSSEIVRVAETLLSISEKLKSFIINASKN